MTDDSAFGDDVYRDIEDEDQLDAQDSLDGDDLRADPLDTGFSPPDHQPRNTRYGTTEREQLEGETLDQRLAEEEADISADDDPIADFDYDDRPADPRSGRLVAPDEGAHSDQESDEIAYDVGIDGAAASAEEAAVHVIEEDDVDL